MKESNKKFNTFIDLLDGIMITLNGINTQEKEFEPDTSGQNCKFEDDCKCGCTTCGCCEEECPPECPPECPSETQIQEDECYPLPSPYTVIKCGENNAKIINDIYSLSPKNSKLVQDPENVLVDVIGDGVSFMVVSEQIFDSYISKAYKEDFAYFDFEEEDEKEVVPFKLEKYNSYLIRDISISRDWEIIVYNNIKQRGDCENCFYIDTFDGELDITDTLDIIPLNDNTCHLVDTDSDLDEFDYMVVPYYFD